MYAIVDIAGQQFKVAKDQQIFVHRLQGDEGASIEFDKVLVDLLRVQGEAGSYHIFKFCETSYRTSLFDYEKLENFILNEMMIYYATKI